jgi:hypothetical protein
MNDIISIGIGIIQKTQRPSASPSAISALKKDDSSANGFYMTISLVYIVPKPKS